MKNMENNTAELKQARKLNSKQRVIGRRLARQHKYASSAYISTHLESFMLKDLWSILFHGKSNPLIRGVDRIVEDERIKTDDKIELMAEFMLLHEQELRPEVLDPTLLKDKNWHASFEGSYFDDQLLSMIFHVKKLSAFALGRFHERETLKETPNAWKYEGDKIYDCYRYAKKAYGMMDENTNTPVPFMKLFNHVFKLKIKDILKEATKDQNPFDFKIKEQKLSELLANAYSAVGLDPKDAPSAEVSKKWMEDKLQAIGAPEEFFKEMNYIISHVFVSLGELAATTKEDENGDKNYLIDKNEKNNFEAKTRAIFKLWDTVEAARAELKANGKQKDLHLLDALLTIKIAPFYGHLDAVSKVMCEDFIDPFLMNYLEDAQIAAEVTERDLDALFYADFKGIKYNTARKKLNLIRHYLISFYVRERE